ncbi:hypothetical protein [Nonomuraea typhae]|uniref:Uncharacterized protein n=1 Tax=Nonomuraea typhae TaxID=2603600 RepID=A0ABW7Z3T7_9ACTN
MDAPGEERWLGTLRGHAARLAFPEWMPGPDDWTDLFTGFTDAGAPYTEVSVYRDHERIHHRVYRGGDLTAFWSRLLDEVAE